MTKQNTSVEQLAYSKCNTPQVPVELVITLSTHDASLSPLLDALVLDVVVVKQLVIFSR